VQSGQATLDQTVNPIGVPSTEQVGDATVSGGSTLTADGWVLPGAIDALANVLRPIPDMLAAVLKLSEQPGANQPTELGSVIGDFEVSVRLADRTVRVISEAVSSGGPSRTLAEQNVAAFQSAQLGANTFLGKLMAGIAQGVGIGLGEGVVGHYQGQLAGLLDQLQQQVVSLLHLLPAAIAWLATLPPLPHLGGD
jgi:hypothetical protein